jgi:lysozyme
MLVSIIRPVPQVAIDFVKAHEGCRLTAYLDSGGVVTVGYGHTGPDVHMGMTITQDQADQYLAADLATAAQRLENAVGEACVTELTVNQYAAMISFTYNVGIDPKWRICQLLKAQSFDQIPAELMRFVNAGGKKLQGLVNRRADEVKLWSTNEPGSVPDDPSSSVTRAVDTPPTSADVKPLAQSKRFISGCVTFCATSAAAIAPQIKSGADSINQAIAPYVGQSSVLQGISSHLALVGALCAAVTVGFVVLQHQQDKVK